MRALTANEETEVLALKPDDITKELLIRYFATFDLKKGSGSASPSKFNINDKLVVPPKHINNKSKVITTIGKYIFNLFIVYGSVKDKVDYINEEVTADTVEDLEGKLSLLLLNDEITTNEFINYLERLQWLGYTIVDFLSPSLSIEVLAPTKTIMDKRKELEKKYSTEILNGDVVVAANIEKELLEVAKKEVYSLPAADLYKSGSKCKFKNDYKNTVVMEDPVKDHSRGVYDVSIKSLAEGEIKDIPKRANKLVAGSFSRAVGTQKGGYITKQFMSAYQSTTLGKPDSDCGTTKCLSVLITKENARLFLFRYIKVGNKLICLDNDNIDSYIGKVVNVRSPLFCQDKQICSKCAGEILFKIGIPNIGLVTSCVSSALLNASLKQFHDATIKVTKIDFKRFIE